MDWNIWEAVIRIIVCLPIVGILAYILVKYGLARNFTFNRGSLKVMERVELMPKSSLSIVRVGNEYMLLGATEKEIVMLKQLEDYQENRSEVQINKGDVCFREKDPHSANLVDTYVRHLRKSYETVLKRPIASQRDRSYGYNPDIKRSHDFHDILKRFARGSEGSA